MTGQKDVLGIGIDLREKGQYKCVRWRFVQEVSNVGVAFWLGVGYLAFRRARSRR